jgi:6-pyruvoyltetrahydropterin/6-carboxytetrahydropterin synthase
MAYQSTKKYGHEVGFSCAFRQWKAESHCRFLHGYSLAFKFIFEADELDVRNWVVDFGSLKSLKGLLENHFDHKTVVAEDDPELEWFKEGHKRGILDLVILPAGGCEKFAEFVFGATEVWLIDNGYSPRCRLVSVEVSEHGANSAVYTGVDNG